MKRKIIKLGQATYVTSLPSAWVRENELKRGDYIEVSEDSGILKITPHDVKRATVLQLDISKLNDKVVNAKLELAYALGYNTIELLHEPNIILYDPHTKKKPDTTPAAEYLQNIVNSRFIGVEIVEQSAKRTVIKDLSAGMNEELTKNVFNRILFLLVSQASDIHESLKSKDENKLKTLLTSISNTRKFILYYSRLSSTSPISKTELETRINITTFLNNINSGYKAIINHSMKKGINYSENALKMLGAINSHLESMKSICLDFKEEKLLEFMGQREKVWELHYSNPPTAKDIQMYFNFGNLMASIWYVVRELFALDFEQN